MQAQIVDNAIHINVFDEGVGIENLEQALEPFYTTRAEDERSGMGFTIMQSFMDSIKVESEKGKGTKVYMVKNIKPDAKA
jgi:stage II sporulation protein AB (anti-sigma F factor)